MYSRGSLGFVDPATAFTIGKSAVSGLQKLFGNDGESIRPVPGAGPFKMSKAAPGVSAMYSALRALTPAEVGEARALYANASPEYPFDVAFADPSYVAWLAGGGNDAKANSGGDSALISWLRSKVAKYAGSAAVPAANGARKPSVIEQILGAGTGAAKDEALRILVQQPAVQGAVRAEAIDRAQQATLFSGPVLFVGGALALWLASRSGRRRRY